ncbi:MAG: hypothetical protein HZA93_01835 [Verrucomicrobia bacterium]|nr:hypothetical protein [Verrucomicrobiota bacterium]
MIATLKAPRRPAAKSPRTPIRRKFWARKSNAELDRAGDWLLANLGSLRADAPARGHSR